MSVDAHYTPVTLGVAVLERFAPYMSAPSMMWEPCVGGEALVRAALQVWPTVTIVGTDIDQRARTGCTFRYKADCRNFRRTRLVSGVDLVFTNPPFSTLGEMFDTAHSITRAIVEHGAETGAPTLIIAPAAWLTSPDRRFGWLRSGPLASTSHLPIGGRVWFGVREMMVYGWNLEGAPYWLPELPWSRLKDPEPEWVDSTDPKWVARVTGAPVDLQVSLFDHKGE